jgi:hypothetical protein
MKTQDYLISYIIIYIIPLCDWATFSYQQKKQYHYIVTVSGKVIPMKPLAYTDGTIEVVYAGSEPYASDSGPLFRLLLDLWVQHYDAKIIYAQDLQHSGTFSPMVTATRWLVAHMPVWIQRKLPKCRNLFTLHSLLPLI